MNARRWTISGVAAALILAATTIGYAGPNRYTNNDRIDRHMLPAVSTGPQDAGRKSKTCRSFAAR